MFTEKWLQNDAVKRLFERSVEYRGKFGLYS